MIQLQAPAKINLTLDVLARREDGYHEIESLFQTINLTDEVVLEPAERTFLSYEGFEVPTSSDNTALRAVRRFQEITGWQQGVHVHLVKRIPPQAGLGGGSSDAAAVLRALARLAGLQAEHFASDSLLQPIAAQIGSDVPFFLYGGTALVTGRGEKVEPLSPLPPFPWVVAMPREEGVPTAWAYAELDRRQAEGKSREGGTSATQRLLAAFQSGSICSPQALARYLHNDFEAVLLPVSNSLSLLRQCLLEKGALRVLLCGSGAAQCALFENASSASQVVSELQAEGYWATACLNEALPPGAIGSESEWVREISLSRGRLPCLPL